MAQWQFELDFHSFWKKEDMTPTQTAEKIAEKISKLLPSIRKRTAEIYQEMADELEKIGMSFQAIAKEKNENVEDFDYEMERLYDWGDTPLDNKWGGKKMCWIKTMFA